MIPRKGSLKGLKPGRLPEKRRLISRLVFAGLGIFLAYKGIYLPLEPFEEALEQRLDRIDSF